MKYVFLGILKMLKTGTWVRNKGEVVQVNPVTLDLVKIFWSSAICPHMSTTARVVRRVFTVTRWYTQHSASNVM